MPDPVYRTSGGGGRHRVWAGNQPVQRGGVSPGFLSRYWRVLPEKRMCASRWSFRKVFHQMCISIVNSPNNVYLKRDTNTFLTVYICRSILCVPITRLRIPASGNTIRSKLCSDHNIGMNLKTCETSLQPRRHRRLSCNTADQTHKHINWGFFFVWSPHCYKLYLKC